MIYFDNAATTLQKPSSVWRAVVQAVESCGNPGRSGHKAAMRAAEKVYDCRCLAADFFGLKDPERVVFTMNATHGLNIAIRTLVKPGDRVLISGFEHNAVTRVLHLLKADVRIAGRKLFSWDNTLSEFERELQKGVDAAVFTHVSNVFGYILPVEQMGDLCRQYGVPFIIELWASAV